MCTPNSNPTVRARGQTWTVSRRQRAPATEVHMCDSESEEEKKPRAKRPRVQCSIVEQQMQEEKDIKNHFQDRAEQQRDNLASGFQGLMEKIYSGDKLSVSEKKVVWSGMKREMNAIVKRMHKFHAACGGTMLFIYSPPMALKEEEADDDSKMFEAFRMLIMKSGDNEETDRLLVPSAMKELQDNFKKYRYGFNSRVEPAGMPPLPAATFSSGAACSSGPEAEPGPGPVANDDDDNDDDDRLPLEGLYDMTTVGDDEDEQDALFGEDYIAFADMDVTDVLEHAAPVAAATAAPVAAATAAPAPAPAKNKAKGKAKAKGAMTKQPGKAKAKGASMTKQPQFLTDPECIQVNNIKKLFYEDDKSIMELSCPKPDWMTYEGYEGKTEIAVTTINRPGTTKFYNCTNSLVTFLGKGFFKGAGLTDLGDLVKWIKDGSSTKGPRAEMKKKIGDYYAGRVYPIFMRFLFRYASKHGGNSGDEEERMARVIQAFKAEVVNPPPVA